MDPLLKLTEAIIRQHASSESYWRGSDYYHRGAVHSVLHRGQQLQAEVEGSQYEPYHVQITLDAGGVAGAICTCPYDWGGWCKHIVATLLACIREPKTVEERPSIESLLAGLDREQLQALVLKLAEHQPHLANEVEMQVPSLQLRPPAASSDLSGGPGASIAAGAAAEEKRPAPGQRRTAVSATVYGQQVSAILHSLDHMRSSEAYWHVSSVVDGVRQMLEQVQDFIGVGDGRSALAILEAITKAYMVGWLNLDDSDGYASAFFDDLGPVWTEALLTADLTPKERRAWAKRLTNWQGELDNYGMEDAFDAAIAASTQGWDYPPLLEVLHGETTAEKTCDKDALWYADELAVARLNVLERQGRNQEYLRLAHAEGQIECYVTMLVRLGRVQEAVKYGLQYLRTPEEALTLAKALRERKEFQSALQIAKHGLALEGPKVALAAWLCELAVGMGETEQALAAATIAFRDSPTLTAYLQVKELAGERWPEIRTNLHADMAKTGDVRNRIEIYLHEGMVNEAIQAVDASEYVGHDVLEAVVDAATGTHPDWVTQRCRAQAEYIMDEGKSQHYDSAARWLEKARAAYQVAGREADWQSYLHELLVKHQRKYSLIPRLEALRG
jgi:uncharacterized Zn finger protein